MLTTLVCRIVIVVFGVMQPAYKSYKALKYKDVKELVRVVMYWVAFSVFTSVETVTDVFLAWLPFYSEAKILIILWLSLPVFQGSSFFYRKFIHPNLTKKEEKIDEAIEKATEKGYSTVMEFGAKGLQYMASTALTTALKGHDLISDQLRQKSQSMNDLSVTVPQKTRRPISGGDFEDNYQNYGNPKNKMISGSLGRQKGERVALRQVIEQQSEEDDSTPAANSKRIAPVTRQSERMRARRAHRRTMDDDHYYRDPADISNPFDESIPLVHQN